MVAATRIRAPDDSKMNCLTWLALGVEHREVEVGKQLSARFEFGAGQLERTRAITRSQHPLGFLAEEAPGSLAVQHPLDARSTCLAGKDLIPVHRGCNR